MIIEELEKSKASSEVSPAHTLEPWARAWLRACREVYGQRVVLCSAAGFTLPLVQVRNRLIALPYAHCLSLPRDLVTQAVGRLREKWPAVALELRLDAPLALPQAGICRDYDTFLLNVDQDVWAALGSRRRGKIRKAQKLGCQVQWGRQELFAQFYDLYAERSRQLGTPPHGENFLRAILEAAADAAIVLIKHEEKPVAASLVTASSRALVSQWAATQAGHEGYYLTDLMYWEMAERCRRIGLPFLDLGRASRGTGLYSYKSQWPADPTPLYYHWIGAPLQITSQARNSFKSKLFSRAWTCLPSPLSRALGGLIRKQIA